MAKQKGPKEIKEERKHKRHLFYIKFGVYIALVVGVVGSQAIEMVDDLTTILKPVELGQVIGAAIVAGAVYNKLENDRGEIKPRNTMRLLRNAIYHGFFWMTIMGSWW